RHATHRGVAARRGRARAGFDVFLVLLTRLEQVGVQVHEAGREPQARSLDHLVGHAGRLAPDGLDARVRELDHAELAAARRGVEDARALDADPAHPSPPVSRYSTAMRTATPFVTWSRMREGSASATSLAISTPRLIGPGCSTIASGLARAR